MDDHVRADADGVSHRHVSGTAYEKRFWTEDEIRQMIREEVHAIMDRSNW